MVVSGQVGSRRGIGGQCSGQTFAVVFHFVICGGLRLWSWLRGVSCVQVCNDAFVFQLAMQDAHVFGGCEKAIATGAILVDSVVL